MNAFAFHCAFACASVVARVGGLLASLRYPDHRFAAERRIRGRLLERAFGVRGLSIGRVRFEDPSRVTLGDRTKLYCQTVLVAGRNGSIRIGADSHLGYNCVLAGTGGISIGRACNISSNVCIYSVTDEPWGEPETPRRAAVTIGDHVLIGAQAVILPGVTVGDGASIGACAVVTCDVAAGAVVGGVPARELRRKSTSAN